MPTTKLAESMRCASSMWTRFDLRLSSKKISKYIWMKFSAEVSGRESWPVDAQILSEPWWQDGGMSRGRKWTRWSAPRHSGASLRAPSSRQHLLQRCKSAQKRKCLCGSFLTVCIASNDSLAPSVSHTWAAKQLSCPDVIILAHLPPLPLTHPSCTLP